MLSDLRRAVELITVVPAGAQWPGGERTGVAGWFPLVGLGIGALSWGGVHLIEYAGWYGEAAMAFAAVIVAFQAWFTRMLHFDGLGDVADAWWGGASVERRLEIMKDSALGSFGVTAISIVVALQVTSIGDFLSGMHQLPLLLVPALARLAATFSAWLGRPAREGGLGRSVMGRPGAAEIAATVAVIVVCAGAGWLALGIWGVGFVALGVGAALVVAHLIALRMGGVTGDVMGASVLVVETVLYLIAAIGLEIAL